MNAANTRPLQGFREQKAPQGPQKCQLNIYLQMITFFVTIARHANIGSCYANYACNAIGRDAIGLSP